MAGAMIVVFGSLNVDIVMRVERLPRPGETVIGGHCFQVQGGKGANQACAAARAAGGGPDDPGTGPVAMVGQVGADDWGRFALAMLAEEGVDLSGVGRASEPTGCATICVDSVGENAIAVASGANRAARAAQVPDGWLGPDTWVVLQMEVPAAENWALTARARAAGARVLLNVAPAAPVPPEALAQVDVLVVNAVEARMLAELTGVADESPDAIARGLAAAHDLLCVATLGAEGAVAAGSLGAETGVWRIGALPVAPVDTTGAGDAFVGCLAVALSGGAEVAEALRFAAAGAGLACLTPGAQSSFARRDDILARVAEIQATTGR